LFLYSSFLTSNTTGVLAVNFLSRGLLTTTGVGLVFGITGTDFKESNFGSSGFFSF